MTSNNVIGYYVHHHGTGHMRRALNVMSKMKNHVYLFSSAPEPDSLPKNVKYVHLPDDKIDGYIPNNQSFLPYTPYDDAIFERNKILIETWQQFAIKHIHVDVSTEVAVLAKLYGLSVSYTVMQGDRQDRSHTLAYDLSDFLIAFSPKNYDIKKRNSETLVKYTGGISRYSKRQPQQFAEVKRVAIITSPQAEKLWSDEIISLARANKNVLWECIGFEINEAPDNVISHGSLSDPQTILEQADVVIGSGGNNTIMELSSLAKPFICIPESRPYDEQVSAANKLKELNAAIVLERFSSVDEWSGIIKNARSLDLKTFSDLTSDDAATVAAGILDDCAS